MVHRRGLSDVSEENWPNGDEEVRAEEGIGRTFFDSQRSGTDSYCKWQVSVKYAAHCARVRACARACLRACVGRKSHFSRFFSGRRHRERKGEDGQKCTKTLPNVFHRVFVRARVRTCVGR